MKAFAAILFAFITAQGNEFPSENNWRNQVSVGIDNRIKYERRLPFGFWVGTDWGYKIVIEGDLNLHMDQRPDNWLLTVSNRVPLSIMIWENRLEFLNGNSSYKGILFSSEIKKEFFFEDKWSLSPYVKIFEYIFNPDNSGYQWPNPSSINHAEIGTKLGLDLGIHF